jgi:cellulose synthase/poly-beta-1,6-N-acetylglucosamine synthase-like glycosyltransferase
MGFARPILEGAAQGLSTTVEDVELTLILGAQGVVASLATDTWVCDPKPPDVAGVIRQRARWLRGQFQAALAHRAEVARLVLRGPAGWGLLSSVLLKPKAFFLPLKALVVAAGWLAWKGTYANAWIALSGFAAASLAIDAGGLLWGLRWIDGWGARLRLLTAAPLYAWIWLRSLALSIVTRERWLRSRPLSTPAPAPELAGEP